MKGKKVWFMLGLLGVLLSGILYILLGGDAVITYHDQLDGEVLCYMYQAKYLGVGIETIPEFLNGAAKSAMTVPAPLFILFFKIFQPLWAFFAMSEVVMLAAYCGMYFLLRRLEVRDWVSAVTGLFFAYLPLIPVYGLSMFGIPLLILGFLLLKEKPLLSYSLIAFYGVASSLVLIGYGVLAVAWLGLGFLWLKRGKLRNIPLKKVVIANGLLTGIYVLTNLNLIAQMLGIGKSEITHKSELAVASSLFFQTFFDTFYHGVQHARASQEGIVIFTTLVLGSVLLHKIVQKNQKLLVKEKILVGVYIFQIAIGVFVALWNCGIIVELREMLGGALVYIQLDRLYWFYPATWYLCLGIALEICLEWISVSIHQEKWKKWLLLASMIFLAGIGIQVLSSGNWKTNIRTLLNRDYHAISWNDFYAVGVLEQVEEYIEESTGQPKEAYRVASLGIYPAAALYHGFYCLDGYSNNYALTYKKQFRKIIAPELDKSEYLKEYYDNWGNRCYLLSAEIPGYFTVEKGGFYFQDFDFDKQAFQEMGGEYIFSAAYIENAAETGLVLLREEPFETEDSYYKIYLYGVTP